MQPLSKIGILTPDHKKFTWGPIQKIHTINKYQIVEYLKDNSNLHGEIPTSPHRKTMFHVYIDGKDTCRSFYSLDSALIGAIVYVRRGPNSQAAAYFDLMTLGVIPEDQFTDASGS